jgi:hypothetical protein
VFKVLLASYFYYLKQLGEKIWCLSDNVRAYLFFVASTGGPVLELCQQLPSGNSSETLRATCTTNLNNTEEKWLHSYTPFFSGTFIQMSGVQMPYYELIQTTLYVK